MWIVGIVMLLAGAGIALWAWPQLWSDLQERRAPPPPTDVFGRPERPPSLQSLDAVGPRIDDRCAPAPWPEGEEGVAIRAAFMDFLDAVDTADSDDPGAWPDPAKAARSMEEAAGSLDHAEAVAELASLGGPGGVAADASCRLALTQLRAARGQGAPRAALCAALARAVWIRSRATQHRTWHAGALKIARWANEALTVEPGHLGGAVMAARAQIGMGHLDPAREALIELMSAHPGDAEVLRTRSRWLRAHGDRRGAADAVLPLLASLPTVLGMAERIRVGPMLIRERQFNDGLEVYQDLVAHDPDEAIFQMGLARCASELRRPELAETAAKAAVQLGAGQAARDLLREVLMKAGRESPG